MKESRNTTNVQVVPLEHTDKNSIHIQSFNGNPVVDSRLIAEALGVKHQSLMETIRHYKDVIETQFGTLTFETGVLKHETSRGANRVTFALLSEGQSYFVATLSRNTEKVMAVKAMLVKSFTAYQNSPVSVALARQQVLGDLIRQAAVVVSSNAEVARRAHISEATVSQLLNVPGYIEKVSEKILRKLERVCQHIIEKGVGYDEEAVELLLQIDNKKLRTQLFNKLKNEGSI